MSTTTYLDQAGATRCKQCSGPAVIRDGRVQLAHLTWCSLRPALAGTTNRSS